MPAPKSTGPEPPRTPVTPRPMPPAGTHPAGTQLSVAIYMHDLSGGGVERQTVTIAKALRQSGVDVTLVLHRLRGPLVGQVPPDLPVVDLRSPRTLVDIPLLARFLRRARPDILLANGDLNNVAALLAKAISFGKTRIVICQHNPVRREDLGPSRLYRHVPALYRALHPLIAMAVGVSTGVSRELTTLARLPAEKVTTIPNPALGPDFPLLCAGAASHPWFTQPSTRVFIAAGRFTWQKDHATLLRALALHRQHHDSRLIILGDGPLRPALHALTQHLNLEDAVDLPGFRENPLPFFRLADAFVLSSRHEGFGNVLVEAMGCGTPVIATNCDHGPAEILDGGRYGVLVPPNDPEALAAAMDDVAIMRARFPADMLRQHASEFGYQVCTERYRALFRALTPDRCPPPATVMAA